MKRLLPFLLLVVLLYGLNTRFGSVPPIGKFLDPQAGFWANAETKVPESEEMDLPGLQDEVSVYFDDRRVPHLFAQNDHDLYYTLGYLTARDRLFQLELQVYDASGRLSEFIGERTLDRDLTTRRWGMPNSAEQTLAYLKEDSLTINTLEAYAAGVNEFIDNLSPVDYPLEYKVFDFEPEAWSSLKSIHLLKNFSRTLAGSNSDNQSSNTLKYFGADFLEKFFVVKPALSDPIIPPSREWDFVADVGEVPDTLFEPSLTSELDPFPVPEGIGSNNWVVSGSKTKSGYPILANDPHLSLTLPSVWYEIQLNAPGINTYGVTMQGAPAVIIGFNESIAWGPTNVGSDVLDWYEIIFKDEDQNEYWHDGQWKATQKVVEEIKVRGAATVLDTVVYTHHGPVTKVQSRTNSDKVAYQALRWVAHEVSNEFKSLYLMNRATNYDDYKEALSHWVAPAQNFSFASNEGDIALWVNGSFPKKWMHQGQTVSDGSDPAYDWKGFIAREQIPSIKNPERGFVSSANQESAAPNYPYYMDDDFAPYERGRRINDILREMEGVTAKDIMEMQMDNYSYHASSILPEMLGWLEKDGLTTEQMEVISLLESWDFHNDADKMAPSFFNRWWRELYGAIFNDEYDSTPERLRMPPRDRVVEVLKEEPNFSFIDNINTDEVEGLNELVSTSFKTAYSKMESRFGPMGDDWLYGNYQNIRIRHVGQIPGSGMTGINSGGATESINATRGGNGPSWRMVVELGPEVKGYGVFPGGASGNPGSPNYNASVEDWRTGSHYELDFMKERPSSYLYELKLSPLNPSR